MGSKVKRRAKHTNLLCLMRNKTDPFGSELNRRRFIKLLGCAGFALAFGPFVFSASDKRDDMEPFHWARLRFKQSMRARDEWNAHPWADEHLLNALHKYTNLNVDRTWHVASLDNLKEMSQYPFIFMTSENKFEFTASQQANFKEYLNRGGFIFADDCVVGRTKDYFFIDIREKLEALFGQKMVKLPNDHEIYRCFYKLNGLPHMQGTPHGGWALFINGRMAVFLSPSDIHCGWESQRISGLRRNRRGWFSKDKENDAIKMGINIIVYALTH